MCVMTVALIATAAAATVSAVGMISSGNAQARASNYNAEVEKQNGEMARQSAAAQAQQVERDNARKMGQITAAYGASGIDPNQGSPLDVMADVADEGELSKRLVLYQGEVDARAGLQRAQIDTMQGRAAQTAGYVNAGSTLLSAGGRIAGNYAPAPSFPSSANVTPQIFGTGIGATY